MANLKFLHLYSVIFWWLEGLWDLCHPESVWTAVFIAEFHHGYDLIVVALRCQHPFLRLRRPRLGNETEVKQSGFALLGRGPLDGDRRVREPEELVIQTADWARQHELQYLGRLMDQRAQRDYLLDLNLSWSTLVVAYLNVVECLQQVVRWSLVLLRFVVECALDVRLGA